MKKTDLTKNFTIEKKWEDFNGHMNVTGYLHYFNRAVVAFFEKAGFGRAGIETERGSFFAAQQQLSYFKEAHSGTNISLTLNLFEMDKKRLHFWVTMTETESRAPVATMESIAIYVDMDSRRSKAMPSHKQAIFENVIIMGANTTIPSHIGRGLSFNHKKSA